MAEVLILGGGFGGLAAAQELRSRLPDDEITLVANTDHFYMGFAKLWDLAGVRPLSGGTVPLNKLERKGVRFRHAEITAIDPRNRRIETSIGDLSADAILVALGAEASRPHLDLLAAEGAYDLYNGEELPGIRAALDSIQRGTVLISIFGTPFKCPPAPYEAALIVDELLRGRGVRDAVRVAVSTPAPMTLPVAGRDASQYVAGHLQERGIELLSEHKVTAVDAARRAVQFANGLEVEFGVLLGVPATTPPAVVRAGELTGPSGWIEPDRYSLRTAFDGVYAVGDCTAIPAGSGQIPKAGVFAAAEGRVAAHNIAFDLGRGEPDRFDGRGFCFLELPGQKVAYVEGNWYSEPKPEVSLSEADDEQFRRKQEYERAHLEQWLGEDA